MANCMVTGGAGFIGSHIVDILVCQGHNVLVVDNLSRGKVENVNSRAQLLVMDIRARDLFSVVADNKIQYVFHAAAQIDVQKSIEDVKADADVNIMGTLNVLEACRHADVQKIIFSSSAAVYGEPLNLPIDESHTLQALSGYGVSKLAAEGYLHMYRELYGLEYTVLRYANVYGPRQDATGEGGVVAIFCRNLLQGQAPVIYGDGEQSRDFIYVEDVALANFMAMNHGNGLVCNVSTGQPTTVNTLLQSLVDISGRYVEPDYTPARAGDILHSHLSNAKAQEELQWSSQTSLVKGLKYTLDSWDCPDIF